MTSTNTTNETLPPDRPYLKLIVKICGAIVLLAGFAASVVAVATFIKGSDNAKSLQIQVESVVPLTPPSADSLAKEISVSYHGLVLRSPHQARVRFINDGAAPITVGDVESPPSLDIMGGEVVIVTSSSRDPFDLNAECRKSDSGRIILVHGLLNPGDSVVCDIIVEGEPKSFRPQGRVAGVSHPTLRMIETDVPPKYLMHLPDALMLFLLLVSSGGTLLGLIVGAFLTVESGMWIEWNEVSKETIDKRVTQAALLAKIQEQMVGHSHALVLAAAPYFRTEWVGSPEALRSDVKRHRDTSLDSLLARDPDKAASVVAKHMPGIVESAIDQLFKEVFGDAFGQKMYANSKVSTPALRHASFEDALKIALNAACCARIKPGVLKRIFVSFGIDDWAFILLLLTASTNVLILVEAWYLYAR